MTSGDDRRDTPAWPLGCLLAGLGLFLAVNMLGLAGILFAAARLPLWLEIGGPIAVALIVPALLLGGGLYARKRNPYAARALLWGFALILALGATLTLIFNLIDWFVLR
jgi:hypothetical protein